ncbi:TPA: autotransporter outer membrane beta-barrel domain-containing protein [Salmonella enterica subsp. enterica serovar Potsdam]|nr:autotransporter outer membrane beta-barrel domain-containing protein [Salmonella enterica subsp. enterica serovar Potsdam]
MAVENKFKLNILAASVMMGLSLSSVAAESSAPTKATSAADAKSSAEKADVTAAAKSLAESVFGAQSAVNEDQKLAGVGKAVAELKFKDSSNSATEKTLAEHMKEVLGIGAESPDKDTSKKIAFTKAQSEAAKNTTTAAQKLNSLKEAQKNFEAAKAAFESTDFKAQVDGINKVYNEKLFALYGGNANTPSHAWKIKESMQAEGTGAQITANDTPDSLYTNYLTGADSASSALKKAIATLDEKAFTLSGGATSNDQEILKAHNAVMAYSAYLKAATDKAQAESQRSALEHYIQEKLPAFIKAVEANIKAKDNHDSDGAVNKTKLDGLYKAFTDEVSTYQKAGAGTKDKSKVYTALDALVTEVVNHNAEAIQKNNAYTENYNQTDAAAFQKALHSVHNILATAGTGIDFQLDVNTTGSLADLLKKAAKPAESDYASTGGLPDGIAGKEITSVNQALEGLKKYLGVLQAAADTKTAIDNGFEDYQLALKTAREAWTAFQTKQTEYKAALNALNTAETKRHGLLSEWIVLNKKFAEAADAYNLAQTAWDISSEKTAVETLDNAKKNYLKALKDTSAGIAEAVKTARNEYTTAIGNGSATAKTQADKNTALYTLIAKEKALSSAKLELDTERLRVMDTTQLLADAKAPIADAEAKKAEAETQYNTAIQEYMTARTAYDADKSVDNELKLSVAQQKLLLISGETAATGANEDPLKNLFVTDKKTSSQELKNGFKPFSELTKAPALKALNTAQESVYKADVKGNEIGTNGSDIQKARFDVANSMSDIVRIMPLATAAEQQKYKDAYNAALDLVGKEATTAAEQSKAQGAGNTTHYLGSLSAAELAEFDTRANNFRAVIVNKKDGKIVGVKDKFSATDLYTGTKDKPFTTTVLDIRALEMGNGDLAATNTISVGDVAVKGQKVTPVDVWAKTAGAELSGVEYNNDKHVAAKSDAPAVRLSGELRTATTQLDENGKPMADGSVVRGADQIELHNVNILNTFTVADRAKMLQEDLLVLNKKADEAVQRGASADEAKDWLNTETKNLNKALFTDTVHTPVHNLTGLQIDTTTVNPEFSLDKGEWKLTGSEKGDKVLRPKSANVVLDHLNVSLQNDSVYGTSNAIEVTGKNNHVSVLGGVFDAGQPAEGGAARALRLTDTNNQIDFFGSVLKGDILSDTPDSSNDVNLLNSSFTGNALTGAYYNQLNNSKLTLTLSGSNWTGGAGPHSPDVRLTNNSVWNVKGFFDGRYDLDDEPHSSVKSLTLEGNNTINLAYSEGQAQLGGRGVAGTSKAVTLHVDNDMRSDGKGTTSVVAGTWSTDNVQGLTGIGQADNYKFGRLEAEGLALGGKYALSLESAGAEPYTIGGRLADGAYADKAHAFVSYKTSEARTESGKEGTAPVSSVVTSTADFTTLSAPAELGVYQYAAEKVMDTVANQTSIYYRTTGQLSNSAATAVSLAAAPVDVTKLESDSLAKHMNSVRHGKDSGVWLSYYGGENRNTTAAGPEYKLKTNGVMVGADSLTENNWLAGVAVSSARSDLSVMNSSGSLNSYGAQFYLSRRYDNGVFMDSALQFNHFSNTAKARMINGQQAKADFSGNSYGLSGKVGYAWNSEGFFAEPYVRAAARVFDGEHYALSNGMTVNSNEFKSMQGEIGADLGYQYDISGGYLKPYLHLAAINEFADGNSVRVNNVSLDNSVKGSAFQAGVGTEVKLTDNLGGYAAFDYTKGENTERPWQATVGVNYTW